MGRVVSAVALMTLTYVGLVIASNADVWERARQEQHYQDCLDRHDNRESLMPPEAWCENLSPAPKNS